MFKKQKERQKNKERKKKERKGEKKEVLNDTKQFQVTLLIDLMLTTVLYKDPALSKYSGERG